MSNFSLCQDGICTCGRAWMACTSEVLLSTLRDNANDGDTTLFLWHDGAGHCGQCGAVIEIPEPETQWEIHDRIKDLTQGHQNQTFDDE